MDNTLRNLQRDAAAGDPEAVAQLVDTLARMGREALAFTGPQEPFRRPERGPHRVTPVHGKGGVARHRVTCAASCDAMDRAIETRTRRSGRAACEAGYQEWLEGQS